MIIFMNVRVSCYNRCHGNGVKALWVCLLPICSFVGDHLLLRDFEPNGIIFKTRVLLSNPQPDTVLTEVSRHILMQCIQQGKKKVTPSKLQYSHYLCRQ
jgi:hypothetical protein